MKLSLLRTSVLAGSVVIAAALAAPVAQASAAGYQSFWTPERMRAATPLPRSSGPAKTADAEPPPGTPTATSFTGVPTVGALFFTLGPIRILHFCTASVVHSPAGNLLLTAAHCVSGPTGQPGNLAFVPEYHDGTAPLGGWGIQRITVAPGWTASSDENLDFAFLTVSGRPVEPVTGANTLGVDRGYDHPVQVIGYPLSADRPVQCATQSFQALPKQMQFYCHGFTSGTSGSPWLIDYDPQTGRGTVIGDIGGHLGGGDVEYTSYSPYFDTDIQQLYQTATGS